MNPAVTKFADKAEKIAVAGILLLSKTVHEKITEKQSITVNILLAWLGEPCSRLFRDSLLRASLVKGALDDYTVSSCMGQHVSLAT